MAFRAPPVAPRAERRDTHTSCATSSSHYRCNSRSALLVKPCRLSIATPPSAPGSCWGIGQTRLPPFERRAVFSDGLRFLHIDSGVGTPRGAAASACGSAQPQPAAYYCYSAAPRPHRPSTMRRGVVASVKQTRFYWTGGPTPALRGASRGVSCSTFDCPLLKVQGMSQFSLRGRWRRRRKDCR